MLNDEIIEIFGQYCRKSVYKSDTRIKNSVIRVLNELVRIEYVTVVNGEILTRNVNELESLSNFELLNLLETILLTGKFLKIGMINIIESIDYLGPCWYTPKEMSAALLKKTDTRHNFRKIKKILDKMEKEGKILKITDIKRFYKYRIMYNH